jgi:hypothetical protein
VKDAWTITWDNGTVPGYDDYSCAVGGKCGGGNYNLSNPDMRSAWVATMSKAMATGLVDGFFIDITPHDFWLLAAAGGIRSSTGIETAVRAARAARRT